MRNKVSLVRVNSIYLTIQITKMMSNTNRRHEGPTKDLISGRERSLSTLAFLEDVLLSQTMSTGYNVRWGGVQWAREVRFKKTTMNFI